MAVLNRQDWPHRFQEKIHLRLPHFFLFDFQLTFLGFEFLLTAEFLLELGQVGQ